MAFLALACGATKKDIADTPTPAWLLEPAGPPEDIKPAQRKRIEAVKATVFGELCSLTPEHPSANLGNSPICRDMMDANDDMGLTEEERESRLTKFFRSIGVRVKFTH